MKKLKLIFSIIIFQFAYHYNYGQEITLEQGSYKILLAEKTVVLQFTYDSLQVGKYKIESDYVNKKVAGVQQCGYFSS